MDATRGLDPPDTRAGGPHGTQKAVAVTNRRTLRTRALAPLAALAILTLAACGGGGDAFEEAESESAAAGGDLGEITVGGADFTEMAIMENMYALLLEQAGFTVDIKVAQQREIYAQSLISGEMDVVPDYAATMAEYFNTQANGPEAPLVSTSDAQETVAALAALVEPEGLAVLEPSEAADQNGFYVTQAFAEENSLTTLSDLAALGQPITLAANDECDLPERQYCAPGLRSVYGLNIVTPMTGDDFASATGKQKVVDGEAQLGLTGTTDGTLEGLGLVILEDDKALQAADNFVPVVNAESAGGAEVADALNPLSAVLTTEDITALNFRVDGQRELPEDVARDYLVEKGLLEE